MRRWDLVSVVLNGVIGAGIFGLPAKVFSLSREYSLIAFVLCAFCASIIVLSFCEVASRFSGSGGPYLYARETYGPTAGFTVGWLVWIARITSFGANCGLLPEYLDLFFPGAASGFPRAVIITVVVVALTAVNVTGVRLVANTSNVFAIGKLLPLAIFVLLGLFFIHPARFHFSAAPGYRPFAQSMLLLVYGFTGFEMAVIPAGEARNPREHLPTALMLGMGLVVLFYLGIQVVCIGTLPGLAESHRPLADAAAQFAGKWGAAMITIGIVMSLAGNLNVLILSGSRIIFAMAEGGALPERLAKIHPRHRVPVLAVLLTCMTMFVVTLSGTFIALLTVSTISRLVAYLATCTALPILRRRLDVPAARFTMPAGVAVGIAGTIICLWLLSNSTLREARDTAITAVVGLGIYFTVKSRYTRKVLGKEPL